MREQLAKLKEKELQWLEKMDITVTLESKSDDEEDGAGENSALDPEDDFKREMLL